MTSKNSTIKNFWMIFFGVVALLAVAVATFFAASCCKTERMRMSVVDDENYYKISEENGFKRSLYAACDNLKNLSANLGKASISRLAENQAQTLTNVVLHANFVNRYLANLPVAESNNLFSCQKFVNQSQDYATFLLKNLAAGKTISQSQRQSLAELNNVAQNFYDFLQSYAQSDSGLFVTNGNGQNNVGTLSDSFNDIDEKNFAYEKLIYDGPFSDAVQQKTLPCAKTDSPDKVAQTVQKLFGEAAFQSQINKGGCWYVFSVPNGTVVTTCDGKIAQYQTYAERDLQQPAEASRCVAVAEDFCKRLGYNVKGVWVSAVQEVTYVTCAPVVDQVVVYPEQIKVVVDGNGTVVGCEARAYLYNHSEQAVSFSGMSQLQAQRSLDESLQVVAASKCVVEKSNQRYYCYEFRCNGKCGSYYVYIDAQSGREVEILKVVETSVGHVVI